MSRGSQADIIPFSRFLECHLRRRIADATRTALSPVAIDVRPQPSVIGTSDDVSPSRRTSVVRGWHEST